MPPPIDRPRNPTITINRNYYDQTAGTPPDAYVKEEEVVPPMPQARTSTKDEGARRADKRCVEASDAALHTHTHH